MANTSITAPLAQTIVYPERDGKPMGETEVHIQALMDTCLALRGFYRERPDVYVGANMLMYYEEGNPQAVVVPDVFVVFDTDKRVRRTYKLWEEVQPPHVVFEFTSRSTRLEDQGNKRALYAWLGVREYFLYDPLDEYLHPPLQGFRLLDGDYARLAAEDDGSLASAALGLRLRRDDTRLRLMDLATGASLPWPDEEAQRRVTAEARAVAEAEARHAAESEVARLRAELARLRGDVE